MPGADCTWVGRSGMTPTTPGSRDSNGTSSAGTRAEKPPMIGSSWVTRPPTDLTKCCADCGPCTMTLDIRDGLDGVDDVDAEPGATIQLSPAERTATAATWKRRGRVKIILCTLRKRLVT